MWGQQRRKQTCHLLCSPTYFHSHTCDTPTQALQLATRSQRFNPGSAPVPKVLINLQLWIFRWWFWLANETITGTLCHFTSLEDQQKSQKSYKTIIEAASRVKAIYMVLLSQPPEFCACVCNTLVIWLFWEITNHLRAFSGGSLAHRDMGKRSWWIVQLQRGQSMTHQELKWHQGLRPYFLTNIGYSNERGKQDCMYIDSVLNTWDVKRNTLLFKTN